MQSNGEKEKKKRKRKYDDDFLCAASDGRAVALMGDRPRHTYFDVYAFLVTRKLI